MKVERSCGCVFCDMFRRPGLLNGKLVHYVAKKNVYVLCTKEEIKNDYAR